MVNKQPNVYREFCVATVCVLWTQPHSTSVSPILFVYSVVRHWPDWVLVRVAGCHVEIHCQLQQTECKVEIFFVDIVRMDWFNMIYNWMSNLIASGDLPKCVVIPGPIISHNFWYWILIDQVSSTSSSLLNRTWISGVMSSCEICRIDARR